MVVTVEIAKRRKTYLYEIDTDKGVMSPVMSLNQTLHVRLEYSCYIHHIKP